MLTGHIVPSGCSGSALENASLSMMLAEFGAAVRMLEPRFPIARTVITYAIQSNYNLSEGHTIPLYTDKDLQTALVNRWEHQGSQERMKGCSFVAVDMSQYTWASPCLLIL